MKRRHSHKGTQPSNNNDTPTPPQRCNGPSRASVLQCAAGLLGPLNSCNTPKVLSHTVCVHQHRTHPCPDTLHSQLSAHIPHHCWTVNKVKNTRPCRPKRKGMLDPAGAAGHTPLAQHLELSHLRRISPGPVPLTNLGTAIRLSTAPHHGQPANPAGPAAAFAGPNLPKPKPNVLRLTAHGRQHCHPCGPAPQHTPGEPLAAAAVVVVGAYCGCCCCHRHQQALGLLAFVLCLLFGQDVPLQ